MANWNFPESKNRRGMLRMNNNCQNRPGLMLMVNDAIPQPLQLSSEELFHNCNTVQIMHAGQSYWLRLTRGNRLILTK